MYISVTILQQKFCFSIARNAFSFLSLLKPKTPTPMVSRFPAQKTNAATVGIYTLKKRRGYICTQETKPGTRTR